LHPEGWSQKATLVALVVVISSLKISIFCFLNMQRSRDVQNPMKISDIGSDIGFLKIKPTSKFRKRKLGFRSLVFKKLTSAVWGQFFTLSRS